MFASPSPVGSYHMIRERLLVGGKMTKLWGTMGKIILKKLFRQVEDDFLRIKKKSHHPSLIIIYQDLQYHHRIVL